MQWRWSYYISQFREEIQASANAWSHASIPYLKQTSREVREWRWKATSNGSPPCVRWSLEICKWFIRESHCTPWLSVSIDASLGVWCVEENLRYPRRQYNRSRDRPLRDSSRSHSSKSWTKWLCDRRLQWLCNWGRENIVRLIEPRRGLLNPNRFDLGILMSKITRMWWSTRG